MYTMMDIYMSKTTHGKKKNNNNTSEDREKNMSNKKNMFHLDSDGADAKKINVNKLEAKDEYSKKSNILKDNDTTQLHNLKNISSKKNNTAKHVDFSHLDLVEADKIKTNVKKLESKCECTEERTNTKTSTIVNSDISGKTTIQTEFNASPVKRWIKLIPTNKTIPYDVYTLKHDFEIVANVVLDNDKIFDKKNKELKKKRKTLIKFEPTITHELFDQSIEWLYLFVINGRIVKIGGTRTGLKQRIKSYLCGHHVSERGKSGDCSKTNGYIYNTFEFYLQQGCVIQMYGYALPKIFLIHEIIGEKVKAPVQTYHIYESKYLKHYEREYGDYPILNDNCDPAYS